MSKFSGPYRIGPKFEEKVLYIFTKNPLASYEEDWQQVLFFVNSLLARGARSKDIRIKILTTSLYEDYKQNSAISITATFHGVYGNKSETCRMFVKHFKADNENAYVKAKVLSKKFADSLSDTFKNKIDQLGVQIVESIIISHNKNGNQNVSVIYTVVFCLI